ncbi:hypothetical protein DSM3645_29242 [Blastopirellula marina DSM 3645]|uniref:Uncharacterized protein n=1 Tax=Blastopirellula marina DSM 3645 TaxID=314230 RepID=A3ZPS0_9BACT|nr:hypothetical protein DSM3645_29242 [Blastopirellula marina DSM 3645]
MGGLITYCRNSPSQSLAKNSAPAWQVAKFEQFARARNLSIAEAYYGLGENGHRVGPKSRPTLHQAIANARATGFPVVAFEWRRFAREPWKLARFADVNFVALVPLAIDSKRLDRICKVTANEHYRETSPEMLGGRPRDSNAPFALPFIMANLGKPWTTIAKQLGPEWNDNKAKRVFGRYFTYEDTLKSHSTKLPRQSKRSCRSEWSRWSKLSVPRYLHSR